MTERVADLINQRPSPSSAVPESDAPRVVSIAGGRLMRGGRRGWAVLLRDRRGLGGVFNVDAPTESLAIGAARDEFDRTFRSASSGPVPY